MIGHMVYFTLHHSTEDNRRQLVDACRKYLPGHDGIVYFAAGTLADGFDREVNDRQWDVALHLVFQSKAAHDAYQVHSLHERFVSECKHLWKQVRVFDSQLD